MVPARPSRSRDRHQAGGVTRRSPLVITPGDPAGIGPEVVCKALAAEPRPAVIIRDSARPSHLGRADRPRADGRRRGAARTRSERRAGRDRGVAPRGGSVPRRSRTGAGHGADPQSAARETRVPAPRPHGVPRPALRCGSPGHGVRRRTGACRPRHRARPLRDVATRLTTDRVLHTIRAADRALREHLGVARPRLAVCANPHAGDQGVLGDEDLRIVAPAVEAARAEASTRRAP